MLKRRAPRRLDSSQVISVCLLEIVLAVLHWYRDGIYFFHKFGRDKRLATKIGSGFSATECTRKPVMVSKETGGSLAAAESVTLPWQIKSGDGYALKCGSFP